MKTIFLALLTAAFAFNATAEKPPKISPIGITEKLNQYLPDDLIFTDENYNQVNLKKIIDKPTVINLVYYQCPGLCSPLLEGLAEVIDRAKLTPGKDYQVLTISFNYLEHTKLAREKKASYLKLVKTKDAKDSWMFFTGDSSNVARLLESVGFGIKREGNDFIHAAALVVVSPEGKITRYLHGTYFLPFDLKMAVTEAAQGKSGPTINKILKFCFSYDPEGKRYVMNITRISGAIILLAAISLLAALFIRKNKLRNRNIQSE